MSPHLQEKLKEFGWISGRKLDDEQLHNWIRTAVQMYDCHVFPEAVRIIREFGGLSLLFGGIHFDPVFDRCSIDGPEAWLQWEWEIEKILFPIGVDYELEIFAVSSDGKIYSEGLAGPCFYDNSFEGFLEVLAGKEPHHHQTEMLEIYAKRNSGQSDEIEQEVQRIYNAIKN